MENNPLIFGFGLVYIFGVFLEFLLTPIFFLVTFFGLIYTLIKKPEKYKLVKRHGEYVWKERFFTRKNMIHFQLAFLFAILVGLMLWPLMENC